jgi:hypothetical protein
MDGAARRTLLRRRGALVALLGLAFVFAWPMQVNGYNQTAHYALAKALADGVPYVDRTIGEVGDLSSGDVARFEGHLYAVKAPGLAFASQPALLGIEAVGMRTTGDPTRAIWVLHLLGAALPALVLVVLVRRVADGIVPGTGLATAVALGLGTIVLPFATLFFAHALSAALGFAAFALLWHERGRRGLPLVAAAGAVAGLAIVAEYQLALVAALLGVYALRRHDPVRRGLAYAGGLVAGIVPLLAFNLWAFGSLTHTPYDDYWRQLEGNADASMYRFPDLGRIADALLDANGLLVLTPLVALVPVGVALLWRRGARSEAALAAGVAVAYLLYVGMLRAEGGLGPPRYLFTLLPFAALPLAACFRALPLTTLALGAVSAFQLVVLTATGALASYDGDWLGRLERREVVQTAAAFVDVTGWYTIVPFFAAALAAALLAAATVVPRAAPWREVAVALAALVGWGLIALAAANPTGRPPGNGYVLAAVVAAGALVAVLAAAAAPRPGLTRPVGAR